MRRARAATARRWMRLRSKRLPVGIGWIARIRTLVVGIGPLLRVGLADRVVQCVMRIAIAGPLLRVSSGRLREARRRRARLIRCVVCALLVHASGATRRMRGETRAGQADGRGRGVRVRPPVSLQLIGGTPTANDPAAGADARGGGVARWSLATPPPLGPRPYAVMPVVVRWPPYVARP